MPEFSDLFINQIRLKNKEILRSLTIPMGVRPLYDKFYKYWLKFEKLEYLRKETLCIDSSDGIIETATGTAIHICRSLGLTQSRNKKIKKLLLNVFLLPTKSNDLNSFRSRFREHIEHLTAIEFLESDEADYIILDGSLFGRISHLPKDTGIEGYQGFMLDYIEVLDKMFILSRKKKIPIIGLAKDSRSRILSKYIIKQKLIEKIENIKNQELREKLLKALYNLPRNPSHSLKMADETGLHEIKQLFRELVRARLDVQIIKTLAENKGYTKPYILGFPSPTLDTLSKAILSEGKSLEKYIEQSFPKAIAENPDILLKAKEILPKLFDYPAIFTSYVLYSENDIPLRIDIPAWYLGLNIKIKEVIKSGITDEYNKENLQEIFSTFYTLYAGPQNYNVLMSYVDSKVKLKRETLQFYEKLVEQNLNTLIQHTRDERRVRYP